MVPVLFLKDGITRRLIGGGRSVSSRKTSKALSATQNTVLLLRWRRMHKHSTMNPNSKTNPKLVVSYNAVRKGGGVVD